MGVTGPGQEHRGCGGQEGAYEYSALPLQGAEEILDSRQGAVICRSVEGGHREMVSYGSAETVRQKAAFVKAYGLGGVFFWTGAGDAEEDDRSLVVAANRVLHRV